MGSTLAGWRGDAVLHAFPRSAPSRTGVHAHASTRMPTVNQRDLRDVELGKAMERMRSARRSRRGRLEQYSRTTLRVPFQSYLPGLINLTASHFAFERGDHELPRS